MSNSRTGRECADHQLSESGSDDPAVLVIDHNPSNRQSLARQLTAGGFYVESFSSNGEFLSAVSPQWVGCVVGEFMMPGEDGVQLLRGLDARSIFLPVIFFSARANVRGVAKAFAAGAFDFFPSPWDPPDLLRCVTRATQWDRANRQMRWQYAEIERRRAHLSDRQRGILAAILAGQADEDIRTAVNVDAATYSAERSAVFDKLGVESLLEMVHLEATRDRLQEIISKGRHLVRMDPSHLAARAGPEWLRQPPKTVAAVES